MLEFSYDFDRGTAGADGMSRRDGLTRGGLLALALAGVGLQRGSLPLRIHHLRFHARPVPGARRYEVLLDPAVGLVVVRGASETGAPTVHLSARVESPEGPSDLDQVSVGALAPTYALVERPIDFDERYEVEPYAIEAALSRLLDGEDFESGAGPCIDVCVSAPHTEVTDLAVLGEVGIEQGLRRRGVALLDARRREVARIALCGMRHHDLADADTCLLGALVGVVAGIELSTRFVLADLGLSSLQLIRLQALLRRYVGREVSLRDLAASRSTQELLERSTVEPAWPDGQRDEAASGSVEPTSFQQGLCTLGELLDCRGAYNESALLELDPAPSDEAMARAVRAVQRRHSSLRRHFPDRPGGRAVSTRQGGSELHVQQLDIRGEDVIDAVVRDAGDWALQPLDLETGPLFRARLMRCGGRCFLQVVAHHAILDRRGVELAVSEVVHEARGAPWRDEHVSGSWQVRAASSRAAAPLAARVNARAERLAEYPTSVELLGCEARPSRFTFEGAEVELVISAATARGLRALAAANRTTLFAVTMLAYQTVLARFTGLRRFLVGTASDDRSTLHADDCIGCFTNLVPIQADVDLDRSIESQLARVAAACMDALDARDLPFDLMVRRLCGSRALDRNPLVQLGLVLYDGLRAVEPGVMPVALPQRRSKMDLLLALEEQAGGGLVGRLQFACDVVGRDLAESLASACRVAFERLGEGGGATHDLLVPAPVDAARLRAWGAGPRLALRSRWFEALMDGRGRALEASGWSMSYAELRERVERVAVGMVSLGIDRGARVGVLMARGGEWPVVALAVMRAGFVYVPLDARAPPQRCAEVAALARVELLVVDDGAAVPFATSTPVVGYGALLSGGEAPLPDVDLEDAAYLLFTSGSSGRPKGAVVAHRGLASLAVAAPELLGLGACDRVLQLAPAVFDASLWEVVTTLACGACLCLADGEVVLPGRPLAITLQQRRISALTATPPVLAVTDPTELPDLRLVVSAGEVLSKAVQARWGAGRALVNAYGPTEATICATLGRAEDAEVVHIGKPLPNARLAVVDEKLREVSLGAPGELVIGGAGVAIGYAAGPEAAQDAFVADLPLVGGRAYRTGDVVRWRRDGVLQFLGRRDRQLKVRGARVQPEEVEAALLAFPGVAGAAVVLVEEDGLGAGLAAFVVCDDEVDLRAIRPFLTDRLPSYMVPTTVDRVAHLSLTPTGKLDRSALRRCSASGEAAKTALEVDVADAFVALLGLDEVSRDADFFELGGHSLTVGRLVEALERRFEVEVPPSAVFSNPTVWQLASELERRLSGHTGGCERVEILVDGAPGGVNTLLLPPAGGTLTVYRGLAGHWSLDGPVYGMTSGTVDGVPAESPSLEAMAKEFAKRWIRAEVAGPVCIVGASMGGAIGIEVARRLRARGLVVPLVALIDTPFPRSEGARSLVQSFDERHGAGLTGPMGDSFRRVLTAHALAFARYQPSLYEGRSLLLVAKESKGWMAADEERWRRVLPELTVAQSEGDHTTVLQEPHVAQTAQLLAAQLVRSVAPGSLASGLG